MILITGASGTVGAAVLQEMKNSGEQCRAMYRNAADAAKAPAGTPTVIADFADNASLHAALKDVDRLYLVCSPIPALVELEGNVIDAAQAAQVKHLVLNSALGAGDYPLSFPSWHRAVEDKLKSSGLSYTILRPNGFMQNILAYMAPNIRQEGAFYAAMGEARTSFLDVADIAAVAAKALLSPAAHSGRTYELNGPEAVSYGELAGRISRLISKEIRFVDIPEEAQRASMLGMGMPPWQVDALLDLQRYYTGGRGGEVTDVLPKLLGREPMGLDTFLANNKDAFIG